MVFRQEPCGHRLQSIKAAAGLTMISGVGIMRRRGLTWIEVIVVLAAVGLLAALFTPVFVRAQQNRQRTACQANLRAIGVAIKQYIADNRERFPPVNGNARAKTYGWADSIRSYLTDANTFQCPSDGTWPGSGDGPKSRNYVDYFYNPNLSGQYESSLQYIASTVMMADAVPGDARQASNGTIPGGSGVVFIANLKGRPIGAATRHLDGCNYAFADGHVKWLKGSDANTTPAFHNNGHGPTFSIS